MTKEDEAIFLRAVRALNEKTIGEVFLLHLLDEAIAERDACRADVRRLLEEHAARAGALEGAGNALDRFHSDRCVECSTARCGGPAEPCELAERWHYALAAIRARAGEAKEPCSRG